ncbi:hypothetical protein RF11_14573 [Thelohanellus kitauei]|uniref:General transcription factor II-I repeat domain-containing protein 2 n=1 Tax=Thelohanellus kitauei TaxID=669202 RepID=A0A0C2NI48_THEKT|nr:hypothetical protein RF11_14573 [Thelohanellus kitauei]
MSWMLLFDISKFRSSALNRREFGQFLSDMNEEYGKRRLHYEGKVNLFTNLRDEVYAFKIKLRLFIRQGTEGVLDAFPKIKARLLENTFNVLQYQLKLESLLEAFESRFDEFEKDKETGALFTNFYLFPESKIDKLHENLKPEIFKLTCNSIF